VKEILNANKCQSTSPRTKKSIESAGYKLKQIFEVLKIDKTNKYFTAEQITLEYSQLLPYVLWAELGNI